MKEIRKVTGQAVPVRGDDIDTDRIIPARFMKCLTFDGLGEYAFYDVRFDVSGEKKDHPLNEEVYRNSSILVSNRNFGCGSSREHAPWALYGIGIRAVVAESFAEIFAGNCNSLGMPAVILTHDECGELQDLLEKDPAAAVELDMEKSVLTAGNKSYSFTMPETYRKALVSGQWDTTALLLDSLGAIGKKNEELPRFTPA
jgi:3-isopropylmalate/(R)-2-methylmalate dehydratase small subunit